MPVQVLMPTFGLTEGEAIIVRWLKAVGEPVQADEPLFEAENEKANLEVPAPQDGMLLQIVVGEDEAAPLGQTVAWIGQPGEQVPEGRQAEQTAAPVVTEMDDRPQHPDGPPAQGGRIKTSPIARRMAREHAIDLAAVQGSGPGGRIVEADIRQILSAGQLVEVSSVPAPEPSSDLRPLTSIRRTTAQRLAESARSTAPVPLFIDVDMSEAQRLRERTRSDYEQRSGAACSYNALIVCAVARALRTCPALNGQWTEEGVRAFREINIGLAVAVDEGLLTPVIPQVDRKRLAEIHGEINELVALARDRKLPPERLLGGTFTVTNLGHVGIQAFIPVINPPQTAILGVGRVSEKVVIVEGRQVARPLATLCLVFDHRAVDGEPAAICLAQVKTLLENPYLLI